MNKRKKTEPAVNPANVNATAALAVIITVLRESVENNREQTRFASDQEMTEKLDSELSELETALDWANFAAKVQPSPVRLREASLSELENELRRRGCAVAVITPADVIEQWKTNQEANETDELEPSELEARDALRLVQRYLDKTVFENEPAFEWGATSDACELISAWRKEGESK